MTSEQLKDLVKSHFNLVEANSPETVVEETVEETFGSLKDVNGAFVLEFPGDSLQVGDKVTVVTTEGQRMDAPDGEHELEDGTKIVTKDSVVEEIISADDEKAMAEEEDKEEMSAETVEAFEEVEEEEKLEEEAKEEEMMEEGEAAVKVEEIVEAIVSEVKDEMKKMEEKMAALEDKVSKMEAMPAAEPTITSTGKKMKAEAKRGFSAFNVETSRNADRIKAAMEELKNRKK